jgi:hypothetical protein
MPRPVTRIRGHYAADGGFRKGKAGAVYAEEVLFTEVALGAAGTFTGSVAIPARATILDVIVEAIAVWDDTSGAAMIVGDDADPNGFFDSVDMKATDLTVGQILNFDTGTTGGKEEGTYLAHTTALRQGYRATKTNVTGVVTVTDGDGTAGRTRMTVLYTMPHVTTPAVGALS